MSASARVPTRPPLPTPAVRGSGTTEPARRSRAPSRERVEQELRKLGADLVQVFVDALGTLGVWQALAQREARAAESEQRDRELADWGPRRVRRTNRALDELCERVLAVLRASREPLAIGAIARALGLEPRALAHPLVWLQERGRVAKSGTRRGTRYRALKAPPSEREPRARAATRARPAESDRARPLAPRKRARRARPRARR